MTHTSQQQVFEIIAAQAKVDVAVIKPESTLKDLRITSLAAIELVFDVEEHFDIRLPGQLGTSFDTATTQNLVDAVQAALDEKTSTDEGPK
jgi:acyl carrier protein